MAKPTCSVGGCDTESRYRGYCELHYQRLRKHGDPLTADTRHWLVTPFAERFWAKTARGDGDGCWEWTSNRDSHGYGMMIVKGERRKAHRLAMEFEHGRLPSSVLVCHRCDNPPCVRPDHLFLGTAADNTHDAMRKGRLIFPPHVPGEKSGQAKVTRRQVDAIRERAAAGEMHVTLAREFGLTPSGVGRIVHRKTWKDAS